MTIKRNIYTAWLKTLCTAVISTLCITNAYAASNGMAINNDSFELRYDPNPSELPYLGPGTFHYSLLISNENHPRSILVNIEAEPAKWSKTWQASKFMLAPTVHLLGVDYQDKIFIIPAAGITARKSFAPLWDNKNSLIEANINLAPGFLALGPGGTVWGSQISIIQPVIPELSAKIGLRFIKAKRDGLSMGKLDQGIYIAMEHKF